MIGVDEVGRGAWAGNLVVAAVRLPADSLWLKLADSKILTAKKRQFLANQLFEAGCQVAYATIKPSAIDRYGLSWAQTEAFRQAVEQLPPKQTEELIVDGNINYLKDFYKSSRAVIKADSQFACVMAASILAKIYRDQQMQSLDRKYPSYGFAQHKGYGTALHLQALKKLKPLPDIHRFSYRPIAALS